MPYTTLLDAVPAGTDFRRYTGTLPDTVIHQAFEGIAETTKKLTFSFFIPQFYSPRNITAPQKKD
jgi:hypothetical protein